MTRPGAPFVEIREVARWWPLILVAVLVAVAAAAFSVSQQRSTYTATTRMLVVPLVQWDETFLGTSLVRDSGDGKRTAATVAAMLESPKATTAAAENLGGDWTPESVADAIKVTAVKDANVVEIVSQADDPERAVRVSEAFGKAVLDERWQTISAELDTRIAAAEAAAVQPEGEAATRLQTLIDIRQASSDPTLRVDPTPPAVENPRLSVVAVVGLALMGGLFIGVLAAVGMARIRPRPRVVEGAPPTPDPANEPAYSPSGGS